MLLWLDLETTGLDPSACRILEVACILTDDKLVELWRWESVTDEALRIDYADVKRIVLEMHAANGLWGASLTRRRGATRPDLAQNGIEPFEPTEHGVGLMLVDAVKCAAADAGLPANEKLMLAGSTPHFDRGFVRHKWPDLDRMLGHRHLDVSAVMELVKRFRPDIHDARPGAGTPDEAKPHRAMADIEHSLALGRYYAAALAVDARPATCALDEAGRCTTH